jgi:D-amino-acid dehydrogenase
LQKKTDILIIGGGAIGICSAYYLNRRGNDVVVVEKNDIGSGSSYGNAGLIVPSHSVPLAAPGVMAKGFKWMFNPESPFYIKPRFSLDLISWLLKFRRACNANRMRRAIPVIRDLNLKSFELFDRLASGDDLDFFFEKKGLLALYKSKSGFAEGVEEVRLLKEYGLDVEILTVDEIREVVPDIQTTAVGGAFYRQDAHLDPFEFVEKLSKTVLKKGVAIHTATEVLSFETVGRKLTAVQTTRGRIEAETVVLAGGAWSPGIIEGLKLNLPIQPAKGYSLTYGKPAHCPEVPIALAEAKVILTPMGDAMRFAGTLELAGMDLSINMRRVAAITKNISAFLPQMDADSLSLIEIWRGLRPCTPDGLPIIGRWQNYDNLIVATGHGMLGISLSPVTGKLVSQLAAGEEPIMDITPLSPDRFG